MLRNLGYADKIFLIKLWNSWFLCYQDEILQESLLNFIIIIQCIIYTYNGYLPLNISLTAKFYAVEPMVYGKESFFLSYICVCPF